MPLSLEALHEIRDDCLADDIAITHEMHEWEEHQVRTYFESGGQIRPKGSPLLNQRVRVVALEGRADLNGQCGTAVAFDELSQRYDVRLDDGKGVKVKAANLERETPTWPGTGAAVDHAVDTAGVESAGAPWREGGTVEIGGVVLPVCASPARPELVPWAAPHGYAVEDESLSTLETLRWMMVQLTLRCLSLSLSAPWT